MVTVLTDWARGPGGWASGAPDAPARPVGVVTVASHTRPRLIRTLGERIASVGRMPLLGAVSYLDTGADIRVPRTSSAQRLRALHGALTVSAEPASALERTSGPVLLVDDMADTGWTLAVAARLLRRAGAEAVFPLVLAVQG